MLCQNLYNTNANYYNARNNTIHLENRNRNTIGIKNFTIPPPPPQKMYRIIWKLYCTNGNYTIRIKRFKIQKEFTDTDWLKIKIDYTKWID